MTLTLNTDIKIYRDLDSDFHIHSDIDIAIKGRGESSEAIPKY